MLKHGFACSHGKRVLAEGSGKDDLIGLRIGFVAIVPCTTVNTIQETFLSRNNTDGQTASHNFAVGRNVSLYPKPGLSATRMNAKTVDDVIKDQGGSTVLGQAPLFMQEFAWLNIRPATLYRLDQDSCVFMTMRFDEIKRLRFVVIECSDINDHILRNS